MSDGTRTEVELKQSESLISLSKFQVRQITKVSEKLPLVKGSTYNNPLSYISETNFSRDQMKLEELKQLTESGENTPNFKKKSANMQQESEPRTNKKSYFLLKNELKDQDTEELIGENVGGKNSLTMSIACSDDLGAKSNK